MAEWDRTPAYSIYGVSLVGCDVFPRVMVEEYRCPWKCSVVLEEGSGGPYLLRQAA